MSVICRVSGPLNTIVGPRSNLGEFAAVHSLVVDIFTLRTQSPAMGRSVGRDLGGGMPNRLPILSGLIRPGCLMFAGGTSCWRPAGNSTFPLSLSATPWAHPSTSRSPQAIASSLAAKGRPAYQRLCSGTKGIKAGEKKSHRRGSTIWVRGGGMPKISGKVLGWGEREICGALLYSSPRQRD